MKDRRIFWLVITLMGLVSLSLLVLSAMPAPAAAAPRPQEEVADEEAMADEEAAEDTIKIGFLAGVQDPFYFTMQRGAESRRALWRGSGNPNSAKLERHGANPHARCDGGPGRSGLSVPGPR